ncbi:MAG: nuclease family protein [Bacteroidetes bacterium]|nr:nuclease family protein [Bacteroidota bacterium]
MENSNDTGIVYLLINPVMPGLVKIGSTYRDDTKFRMNELYSTGVPLPFECIYAAKVKNPEKVEGALHTAFAPDRINARREFFEIEATQAIAILKLLEIEDSTMQIEKEVEMVDSVSLEAGKEYSKKRPKFNFIEMGIPIGSEIVCTKNGETAIIDSDHTIFYKGESISLTSATRSILGYAYNVAPGPYWTFNARPVLRDIKNRIAVLFQQEYICLIGVL